MKKLFASIAVMIIFSFILSSCTEEIVKPKATDDMKMNTIGNLRG